MPTSQNKNKRYISLRRRLKIVQWYINFYKDEYNRVGYDEWFNCPVLHEKFIRATYLRYNLRSQLFFLNYAENRLK